MSNPFRTAMVKKAKKDGVCTQCFKRKAMINRLRCTRCTDTGRRKQQRRKRDKCPECGRAMPLKKIYVASREKRREYNKTYKKKQQYKKARALALIRSATEKGTEL